MNAPHLHLIVSHLPIVGIPLAAVLLAWGLRRKSREVVRASLGLAIVLAVVTYPVFLTGEQAEEAVEEAAWADEAAVERHEERALVALIVVLVAGAVAATALWQLRGERRLRPLTPAAALVALVTGAVVLGWTGFDGGGIRHDEIGGGAAGAVARETEEDEDQDEHNGEDQRDCGERQEQER